MKLHDNVPSIGLAVKTQISLKTQHAGFEYEVACLLNSSKYSIGAVKEMLEVQRSTGGAAGMPFTQVNLTWQGLVVPNEVRVDALPRWVYSNFLTRMRPILPITSDEVGAAASSVTAIDAGRFYTEDVNMPQAAPPAPMVELIRQQFIHPSEPAPPKRPSIDSAIRSIAEFRESCVRGRKPAEVAQFNALLAWIKQECAPDELDLSWFEHCKLIGHRGLTVLDLDLGEQLQVELSELTDNMLLKDVLTLYQTHSKRMYLCAPLIARWTEMLSSDNIAEQPDLLDQEDTLFQSGLDATSILALKTQMFDIVLKEESEVMAARSTKKGIGATARAAMGEEVPGTHVKVFDWWKIRQVKDAYSMAVTDSLSPADQLLLDTPAPGASSSSAQPAYQDELDDNDKLYKYHIRPLHVLLVKREDFTAPTCMYICADCGNDVKLKARDAVRCRECFHRILFKKRINKPCQYICR